MKITILGCGTFFVNKERSGPAYLLEANKQKILIDCGPGTLMRLAQVGIKPDDIDYVLISHFHADHTADLFPFLMNLNLSLCFWQSQAKEDTGYLWPKGVEKIYNRYF